VRQGVYDLIACKHTLECKLSPEDNEEAASHSDTHVRQGFPLIRHGVELDSGIPHLFAMQPSLMVADVLHMGICLIE